MNRQIRTITPNYNEARQLYRQQLQLYNQSEIKDENAVVTTLSELVRLAMLQGDYDDAQQVLEYKLAIAQDRKSAKEQVDILLELAALYHKTNELDKAYSLCQQAFEIAHAIDYRVGIADTLKQQASIRRTQRDYQIAQKLYQAALVVASEIGDQVRAGEIREELAALEVVMGKDIFISYSHHDRDFVERLARDLRDAGLTVWWDEWEIKVGDSIIQKVSEGINQSAYLAVVLSPHSVKSNWVQRELGSALMKQLSAERDITVLPLLVADCEIPVLLRAIKWADFRTDYETGLRELLGAIATERSVPSPPPSTRPSVWQRLLQHLRDPVWQGIGAIVGIIALLSGVFH